VYYLFLILLFLFILVVFFYPDVTARDFLVSWAMFEGVTATYNEPQYRDRVERARILVLRSILTPAAH
jgi:hypothetical protein